MDILEHRVTKVVTRVGCLKRNMVLSDAEVSLLDIDRNWRFNNIIRVRSLKDHRILIP